MAAKKNMNELKRRALLAKQRMKMGYWEQMMRDRDKLLSETGPGFEAEKRIRDYERERYNREFNVIVSPHATEDDKLYEVVCAILESDELIINPIARLIDKKEYEGLDSDGRQRYILELAAKFRELKERYNREHLSGRRINN